MIVERFRTLSERKIEVDWIVEGLLTAGEWTYFVGDAGAGKSMLMIQLCDSLQEGKKFLGMKCKKRNCLYIQVDTGRAEWQEQVKRLAGDSFAWTMYALPSHFLDNPRQVELIRQIVWGDYDEKHQNYKIFKGIPFDFIVFDVLNKMTSRELNGKDGASFVIHTLDKLTKKGEAEDRINIPYVLVHHPSKAVKKGVTAGAGSSIFGGLCGNMMTLTSSILTLEKSKVRSSFELLLERANNGAWHLLGEEFEYNKVVNVDEQGMKKVINFNSRLDKNEVKRILE